jgi:hypothetical protein
MSKRKETNTVAMYVDRVTGTLQFAMNGEMSSHVSEIEALTDLNKEIWPVISVITLEKLVCT